MYTQRLAMFIKSKGISLTQISNGTGISYSALTDSLSNSCRNRPLRADEFFKICEFLEKNPADFMDKNLKEIKTKDLVNELSVREGVSKIIAEPYKDENIKINGPAVILIVVD